MREWIANQILTVATLIFSIGVLVAYVLDSEGTDESMSKALAELSKSFPKKAA